MRVSIKVMPDLRCPNCGITESTYVPCPDIPNCTYIWIRGYKVQIEPGGEWWSECLLCKVWFTDSGQINRADERHEIVFVFPHK